MTREIACLVFYLAFVPTPLCAEIILDDFVDPSRVTSPEMGDEFDDTENVGDLAALRRIRIGLAGNGSPEGKLDSGLSVDSTLTGTIVRLNPASPISRPIAAIQVNYSFEPTDLAANGNNAFFLDFIEMTSSIPPSLLLLLIRDGNDVFVHSKTSLARSSAPFTLVVPFNKFPPRGGGFGGPDYTRVESIDIELRASELSGGGPDPLNFSMQLDRIRIGRIPEPNTAALLVGGLLMMGIAEYRNQTTFLWRKRRCACFWFV
jgi:hypothetical protein